MPSFKNHNNKTAKKGGAYCVKCKTVRSFVRTRKAIASNGRSMLKGKCRNCGTKMNKFV